MNLATGAIWTTRLKPTVKLLSLDGWDDEDQFYTLPLTRREFEDRFMQCRVIMPHGIDFIWM